MRLSELMRAPYLHDEEPGLSPLAMLTKKAIELGYSHLASVEKFEIYARKASGFIAVIPINDDRFDLIVDISGGKIEYPVEPTQLENYQQVSLVRAADGKRFAGIAKETYHAIVKRFDLVSDHEQYLGCRPVWDSLSSASDINIYVFDGSGYVRESGKPLKFNGQGVVASMNWAQTVAQRRVLLVATSKELT